MALYREKLKHEEEGIENKSDNSSSRLVYVFKEQIPVNKFKNINQNIANIFQGFASCTHSALTSFAEYLQKSVFHRL